jgi:hypothetical protein
MPEAILMYRAVSWRLWSCCVLPWLLGGASAFASTPWTLPARTVQTTASVTYLGWDGRALAQVETGVAVGITAHITAGAAYRGAGGHGRDAANRYTAHGYGVWGDFHIPGTGLAVHLAHDGANARLRAASADASLQADPIWRASGAECRAAFGPVTGRAGAYQVETNSLTTSAVYLAGGGVGVQLAPWLRAEASATGFIDEYPTPRATVETTLGVRARRGRGDLAVTAAFYPRGVPLAGSALSTAATIGAVYGSDAAPQLHTAPVGYISASAGYRF